MQFYRCKCGRRSALGSMSPSRCSRCPDCGSDLATHPDRHREPAEHEYVTRYNEITGVAYEWCRTCQEPRERIEVNETPTAQVPS